MQPGNPGKCRHPGLPIFPEHSAYFNPSGKDVMINFMVKNLKELPGVLKNEGVDWVGEPVVGEYGKFGWILDPEGNKTELWEPPV